MELPAGWEDLGDRVKVTYQVQFVVEKRKDGRIPPNITQAVAGNSLVRLKDLVSRDINAATEKPK